MDAMIGPQVGLKLFFKEQFLLKCGIHSHWFIYYTFVTNPSLKVKSFLGMDGRTHPAIKSSSLNFLYSGTHIVRNNQHSIK